MYLGIEIGGTKLQIVTGDENAALLATHRFTVDRREGALGIRSLIEQTIRKNYIGQIAATGIGFGGPVNWQTGQIATSFHIEGWSDFNFIEWLEPIVGGPVFIENDANVAALGEAIHGAGRGHEIVLYVTIGSGIGGGLIIDKQIYHGAAPGEVEIGHIRLSRQGETFQDLCSGWGIDARIRKLIAQNPGGILARLVADRKEGEASFLRTALEQDDPDASLLFDEIVDDIAFGLSHAIHLFHPDVVILGGGVSLIGEVLRSRIENQIPYYLMTAFRPGPLIRLAELKEHTVPVGSLLLAAQKLQEKKSRHEKLRQ